IFDILPAQPITTRRSPAGTERDGKSRPLVLVATMRSPTTGSPDHTHLRAHLRQATTTSASDRAPIFPHARASPKRDHITHLNVQLAKRWPSHLRNGDPPRHALDNSFENWTSGLRTNTLLLFFV